MATAAIQKMLDAHPWPGNVDHEVLARCIDECFTCAQTCTSCADACLSEKDMVGELTKCIRLNLDCADICEVTGGVLIRQTGYDAPLTKAQLEACREACATCAEECERHADMRHCVICAEACRRCQQACDDLLAAMK
jgi:hypothetical protein